MAGTLQHAAGTNSHTLLSEAMRRRRDHARPKQGNTITHAHSNKASATQDAILT